MKICTIGYEGLDIDAFMSLLAENDIETVVDVREMPLSRKPGFSKKALEAALNLSGREYVHMVALGCPKPIRDRYREDGNWKRYTEGFEVSGDAGRCGCRVGGACGNVQLRVALLRGRPQFLPSVDGGQCGEREDPCSSPAPAGERRQN